MAQPKPERFRLLDTDGNITEDSTFGTTWRDTWDFECPAHMRVILQAGDEFSLHARDANDAEFAAPDAEVQIEVRDPSGQKKTLVYGPANYVSSSEFQEKTKMAKLRLEQPIEVRPRDHIVIMTKDDVGMDAVSIGNSYFRLLTTRIVEVEGDRL